MGQDYAARKIAKKKWKKHASNANGKEGTAKRERKKKNAPRRLCQGMCYQAEGLELKPEDLKWNGGVDSDDSDDGNAEQVCDGGEDSTHAANPAVVLDPTVRDHQP
jgi:hypothetical protein